MFDAGNAARPAYRALFQRLSELSESEFEAHRKMIELLLRNQGVTFTVYSDDAGIEKVFPFDATPRLVSAEDWSRIERGLAQRTLALNLFLADVYGDQKILDDKVVDPELVCNASFFRREMIGLVPPRGIYTHIVGTDLVRDVDGTYDVLEDNARNPSGVSYVLGMRDVMKRVFRDLFEQYGVRPVDEYATWLRETLPHLAPSAVSDPTVVVLTPGLYNSAYFERRRHPPQCTDLHCFAPSERRYILENIEQRVVKQTDASGGDGILVGPHSTKEQHEEFRRRVAADPRNYIAQPTLSLSKHPTLCDSGFEGRCVDLRPYVLYGDKVRVLPGGLTRVARRKGSLVVNLSQGGGY